MPRYIDVEKAIEAIDDLPNCPNGYSDTYDKACIIGTLEEVPTADVVQVVRCKDCFYAVPYNERWTLPKKNNCMWCRRYEDVRTTDWFCADGERREE